MAVTYEQLVDYQNNELMPYISFGSFQGLEAGSEGDKETTGKNTLFDRLFEKNVFDLVDGYITIKALPSTIALTNYVNKIEKNGNIYTFTDGNNTSMGSITVPTIPSSVVTNISYDGTTHMLNFTTSNGSNSSTGPITSGEGAGGTVTGGSLTITNAAGNNDATIQLNLTGGSGGSAQTLSTVKTAIKDPSNNNIVDYFIDASIYNDNGTNKLRFKRGKNSDPVTLVLPASSSTGGISSVSLNIYDSTSGTSDASISLSIDGIEQTSGKKALKRVGYAFDASNAVHIKGYYSSSGNAITAKSTEVKGYLFSTGNNNEASQSIRFIRNTDTKSSSITGSDNILCLDSAGNPFVASITAINSTSTGSPEATWANYAQHLTTASNANQAASNMITGDSNGGSVVMVNNSGNLSATPLSTFGTSLSVNYATSAGSATTANTATSSTYTSKLKDSTGNILKNGVIYAAKDTGNLDLAGGTLPTNTGSYYLRYNVSSSGSGSFTWLISSNVSVGSATTATTATAANYLSSTAYNLSSDGTDYRIVLNSPEESSSRIISVPTGSGTYALVCSTNGTSPGYSWVATSSFGGNITKTQATANTSYYLLGCSSTNAGTLTEIYCPTSAQASPYFKNGNLYQTSDENLKTFVTDLDVDLDKLATVKKGLFYWKKDPSQVLNIGITAQSIAKLYPQIVTSSDEGIMAVSYSKLGVVALAAIDKLNQKIKDLEAEIKELKSK